MKVTWVKGDLSSGKPVELDTVVEYMKDAVKAKPVKNMREMIPYCSPGSRAADAEKVPVILFASGYKEQDWKCYNGLVLLEFNRLANISEARRLRDEVVMYNQPLLAFVGSSGLSVKVVVRYTLPDGSLPVDREMAACFHAHAYRRAMLHYQAQLQWEAEYKEPSLDRGCRISYDPECFYNPDSLPVRMEQPLAMPEEPGYVEKIKQSDDPLERILPGTEQRKKIEMLFETCLNQVYREQGPDWEEKEPKNFIAAVSMLCFDSGVPEEDVVHWLYFRMWNLRDLNLLRQTVHNVYLSRKAFGKKPCLPSSMNLLARMEEFLKRRYEFRKNEIIGEVEYRERLSFRFRFNPLDKRALNSIALDAQMEGIPLWDRDISRYIYSNRVPVFNPLEDFLYRLPGWDGKDRIRELAATVPCRNPYWTDLFHRWFLNMVSHWRGYDKKYANSVSPLLVGAQGTRKSTFCRSIMPPSERSYYTDSIDFSRKKDAELYLNRFALINIDEFDQVSSTQQGFLKHILQKPVVNMRKPHASAVLEMRRYASFIATSNQKDLLTDPSGSRRFICIEVTGVIDTNRPIDYEQLYAQAMYELEHGERYWFDQEDEKIMMENNREFEQVPPEEQLFFRYFRAAQPEEGEWLSPAEIMEDIQRNSSIPMSVKRVNSFGRILKKQEIPSKHVRSGTLYHVVKLVTA